MVTDIIALGRSLLERVIPDPKARAEAQLKLEELHQAGALAQLEINKVEAANPNIFVSGWRPFTGWVCSSGLAIQFVIAPLVGAFGIIVPALPMETLLTCLGGLLGLGGLRTYERAKGVVNK